MVDKMEHDHEHEKDSFEPLKAEYYEGKHLSAPVKEIQVILFFFAIS
jgi:DNA-directed RNA polymerase III subunit RPC2